LPIPCLVGIELLRSKASQEKPVTIAIDRQHNPRAFAALERWIDHAEIAPGTALFRRIKPRGGVGGRISADGVNRAVKSALARYYRSTGVPPDKAASLAARFSGQSGSCGLRRRGQGGRGRRHGDRRHHAPQVIADDQALWRDG